MSNWPLGIVSGANFSTGGVTGTLWVWGYDDNGTAMQNTGGHNNGGASNAGLSSPIQIHGALADSQFSFIATGHQNVAMVLDGKMYGAGADYGIMGLAGNTADRRYSVATQMAVSKDDWAGMTCGLATWIAVDTSGKLWSWGYNYISGRAGMLGRSTALNRIESTPTQIGSETYWDPNRLFSDRSCFALINTNDELFMWGENEGGQLGDGTIISRSSPVQIAGTDWNNIAIGNDQNSAAVKNDGTLWTWGGGAGGSLGNNTANNNASRSSPVQLGSDTDWARVVAEAATPGNAAFHCVKTDGTLWAWGTNYLGSLGLGDVAPRSSPTQVGEETYWSSEKNHMGTTYSARHFIDQTGRLWGWGATRPFGQLGNGIGGANDQSSPVQIGSATDWLAVEADGNQVTVLALRTPA